MRWKTEEIKKLLSKYAAKVEIQGQGGDYDSTNIVLTAHKAERGNHLYILGFDPEQSSTTPDDMEIESIEVTDGQDSSGGLNSDDEPTCVMYGKVCAALRRAGFDVVPSMNDYF